MKSRWAAWLLAIWMGVVWAVYVMQVILPKIQGKI